MEEQLEQVLAAPIKSVFQEQAFRGAIQQKAPSVHYRLWKRV